MNDLASHIFDTANAMNRAKAAELAETPKGRWDTVQPSLEGQARHEVLGEIAPHIAKIPLRAEVRDMLIAAKLYDEQADAHRGEMERLEQLARQAREQAENLRIKADL